MIRATMILTLLAAPAAASADRVRLPQGCTAYMTVQTAGCTVSHHFTCEADPEGWQRRVDLDADGMAYFGAIDSEGQWLESFHLRSDRVERLAPDPADPASFTELTETGSDSYDFTTLSEEVGKTRYVGHDRLVGETVTIDGVELERTEYSIRAIDSDGEESWRSAGREFISRDRRLFLSGVGRIVTPEGGFETDDTPVEFIFPDEAGFLSSDPKHGCGATMSSAPAADIAKEIIHDHL